MALNVAAIGELPATDLGVAAALLLFYQSLDGGLAGAPLAHDPRAPMMLQRRRDELRGRAGVAVNPHKQRQLARAVFGLAAVHGDVAVGRR